MSDQFKNHGNKDNESHSQVSFRQEQISQEPLYEIPTFGKLKGLKDSHDFILPFATFQKEIQEDSEEQQPEPFNFSRIQSFQSFSFDFLRGSDKFGFETHLYIFYNVGEQKRQLESAIKLYQMGMKLHRSLLIWAKCSKRGHWSYFDIQTWKNIPLPRPYIQEEYFDVQELQQALRQL